MILEHQKSQHPNVHRAFSPWSEEQVLHVAVMYSNPCRWDTRRELFNDFRKHMEAAANVRLYVGEVAFGDRPHEVTSADNPLDFQFRTSDELWHKENVLNVVVSRMPENARYIGYCDGDIQMSRHDWALEAIHQLQHYEAVQLFHQFTDMDVKHKPIGVTNGFAYEYMNSIIPPLYQESLQYSTKRSESASLYAPGTVAPKDEEQKKSLWWGATGLAWAFRRSTWNALGGLLDVCILGSADWHMAYGMAGLSSGQHHDFRADDAYTQAILDWQEKAQVLKANIGYVDNHITHYWHGPKTNRFYRDRTQILVDNQFNPGRDLKRDWQGLYQLSGNKPRLRDDLRAYFRARNEDIPA